MSHQHEVEVLRRRALVFLRKAAESLEYGEYDFAAFFSEQSVQLFIKSLLLEKVGDYPRTHSLSALVSILRKVSECNELVRIFEERRIEVGLMEDAYINARYLVREYSREEAEALVNLAREVVKSGEVCRRST